MKEGISAAHMGMHAHAVHADRVLPALTPSVGWTPEGRLPREDKGPPSAFGTAAAGEAAPAPLQQQPDGPATEGKGSNAGALLQVHFSLQVSSMAEAAPAYAYW